MRVAETTDGALNPINLRLDVSEKRSSLVLAPLLEREIIDEEAIDPDVLMLARPPMVPDMMALPDTLPGVEMVPNLVSAILAMAEMSASLIVPSVISADTTKSL